MAENHYFMKNSHGEFAKTSHPIDVEALKKAKVEFFATPSDFMSAIAKDEASIKSDIDYHLVQSIDGEVVVFPQRNKPGQCNVYKASIEQVISDFSQAFTEEFILDEHDREGMVYIQNAAGYLIKTRAPLDLTKLESAKVFSSFNDAKKALEIDDGEEAELTSFALVSVIDGAIYVSDFGGVSGFVEPENDDETIESVINKYSL